MRRGVFVPFAAVAAVLLASCSDGTSGRPGDPIGGSTPAAVSVSVSPSSPGTTAASSTGPAPDPTAVPADVPTTGPNLLHKGERPPVMPLAATEHTPAGAVAFATFFELTIDWAYATTSTAYMKHYYEPTCITCTSIRLGLDKAAAQHHHFIGGRMTITSVTPRPLDGVRDSERSILVAYRLTSIEVVNQAGVFVDADPSTDMKDQIWLAWRDSAWTVVEMGPVA